MRCRQFLCSALFRIGQKTNGDKNETKGNPIGPAWKFASKKEGKQKCRCRPRDQRSQSIDEPSKRRGSAVKHENEHREKSNHAKRNTGKGRKPPARMRRFDGCVKLHQLRG